MKDRSYFYNHYYYDDLILLETAYGLLGKLKKGGKIRNMIAGGLKHTRKGHDRPVLASMVAWPGPGSTAIGAALMAVPNHQRARIYHRALDNPKQAIKDAPGAFVRSLKDLINKRKRKAPTDIVSVPA